ncbi:MAG: hydrogenase maturation nickel metallochaperone HypA [Caldithrix sp.]|nr:hydrogenase maturation nickel metallochaperone HypA [Caldithrix sp.]
MHEMSIALNVVDIAVQNARREKAQKINEIVLEVGALSGVVAEALQFCFSSACKQTMADGATLEIIHQPAEAVCDQCGHQFDADQMLSACPQCGQTVMATQGGRELKIKSINID